MHSPESERQNFIFYPRQFTYRDQRVWQVPNDAHLLGSFSLSAPSKSDTLSVVMALEATLSYIGVTDAGHENLVLNVQAERSFPHDCSPGRPAITLTLSTSISNSKIYDSIIEMAGGVEKAILAMLYPGVKDANSNARITDLVADVRRNFAGIDDFLEIEKLRREALLRGR